ncbi:MAG: matrixin family metalloprotease [Candidatus Doudnabacteria bacterium]|nr:matrixin family metalloprotease [Candidatus Doudnabacteria bacterium]
MFNKIISGSIALSLVLLAGPASAMPNHQTAELSAPGTNRVLTLPTAADNSPVISLGTAIDPQSGKVVEGIAIVHPKKTYDHKPQHDAAKAGGKGGGSSCYAFLANGAKWKSVENWAINTNNNENLTGSFVFDNFAASLDKWETAGGANIFGNGAVTSDVLSADTESPDGVNEVYFGDVGSQGAIAVTIVWGIFSGPPFARELVEWDMVLDEVDFDWSATGEAGKMDYENITTHEIGHAAGMGHPDDSCLEETMYRFADYGETKKRDLNAGDIAGIDKLY